jgi:hypothetical protein
MKKLLLKKIKRQWITTPEEVPPFGGEGMERRLRQRDILNFTPLESPDIYVGDAINIKPQFIIECGVKDPSFLTG